MWLILLYRESVSIAIHLNPDIPEAYNSRGIDRKQIGDFEGALEDFNRAIELAPSFAQVYYNRAILHLQLGDSTSATAVHKQRQNLLTLKITQPSIKRQQTF